MTCKYCESIQKKDGMVYEEDGAAIILHKSPAMPGHMLVVPKEHFTIIEQTPDAIVMRLAALSNKASTALLKVLGAAGTNVIIENGTGAEQQVPHIAFNVIPRIEGDGLNFQWQPKKLSEEQMNLIELQLKEQAKNISVAPEKKAPLMLDDEKQRGEVMKKSDYLTRQLRRIP